MHVLELIGKDELKRLSRRSDARATWIAACNFALVAAGFAIPILWTHWLAWAAGALVLAGRALGLGILVHDTAHHAMFTSRAVNEWTGRWLFGGLPNVAYHRYREGHLAHHRHAGTEHDPDLGFVDTYPASGASLLRKLLRDLSGINGIKNIAYQARTFTLPGQAPFLCSHVLLAGSLWAAGHVEVYGCWWLGQVFFFPLLVRLRVMGEHGGVPDHFSGDPRLNTGTTLAGPLARLLVAPNRVNFHIEHHLAPVIPSYRLKEVHALAVAKGCYAGFDCVRTSYVDVLKRCWSKTSAAQRLAGKRRAEGMLGNMQ
ncbi:fatty acid desaturase family protein [Noviherbaspirillum galbum]|uniref:Fatty acid desaturase family protein n=1 Tax=Noviherbaspirillum galbum TaxID=2709383 RepID=A0A6B3SFV5_9BURK|nr:fatty acid desaturase family protein [Noviherbaspirillum galbum]NEX59463.1 fatty acid desaturase family protein [Noviherbaspirillum galbum]